jgi:2-methylcitrate dehydratase
MPTVLSKQIAQHVIETNYGELDVETVEHVKKTLIDTVSCAIGGFHSLPAKFARTISKSETSSSLPSRILGTDIYTTPEMASFTNTVMIRYLDCNDSYFSPGGGHPSDMIGAALTLAQSLNASGKELITSIVLGYDIFCALSDEVVVNELGWDQGLFLGLSAACIASKLLGLSKNQIEHAVSLSLVPNLPLGVTRVGELSMWKGCATANAVKSGVFAARLAQTGLTGPENPFESPRGLWEQMGLPNIEINELNAHARVRKIQQNIFKYFPSQIHTQSPIGIACELSAKITHTSIENINILSYKQGGVSSPLSQPEKWNPTTRETADHSIPYLVAAALIDGTVNPLTFSEPNFSRESIKGLMKKTTISELPEFSQKYPKEYNCNIEIKTKSGEKFNQRISFPKGHKSNPFTNEDVESKFTNLTTGIMNKKRLTHIFAILGKLENSSSINDIFDAVKIADTN